MSTSTVSVEKLHTCRHTPVHSVHQGGMTMTVTHQHPSYDSEQERLDQLQRLKRTCTTQIHNQRTKEKSA